MNRFFKGLIAPVAAVALASCCCSSSVVALSGEWVIDEVNGKETMGEMTPFIGFNQQDSTVYGSNSCNRFFGTIVYTEGESSAISFANVGSTRMLCQNSPMEEEIQTAINNVAGFEYTDEGAQLLGEDGTVLLVLSPKAAEAAE